MSLSLINGVLDDKQKSTLAKQLIGDLQNEQSLLTLCDLLPFLDSSVKDSLYPEALQYCINSLQDSGTDYLSLNKLMESLPKLSADLLRYVDVKLEAYLNQHSTSIIPEFRHLISTTCNNANEEIDIKSILQFLEIGFRNSILGADKTDVDEKIAILLGSDDLDISNAVSGLYRWRIQVITDPWSIIYNLERQTSSTHKSHAYILWLRYLTCESFDLKSVKSFQDQLQTETYWKCIQNGLRSSIAEHRKFCLSILQVSVKCVGSSICNNIMQWELSRSKEYLKEWSRFVTLFEIIGIDTSQHQAEAGAKDIVDLVSPKSLINPSWGFTLLYTGFTASLDSVRKFTLSLFLSIPKDSLHMVKYDLPALESTFLPYSMLALHFWVRRIGFTNENYCEYGDKLTLFVQTIIEQSEPEDIPNVVSAILNAVVNCETFSPAKIYVLFGLLKGLKDTQVLSYGSQQEELLISLMEINPEGDLFATTFQTIVLRLLTNFKLNSLDEVFPVLDKFGKFNTFELIKTNFSYLKNYLCNFTLQDFENYYQKTSFQALVYSICKLIYGNELMIPNSLIQAEILSQGLVAIEFKEIPVFETAESEFLFYEFISCSEDLNVKVNENFYNTLKQQIQAQDVFTLQLVSKKLKFFSKLPKHDYLDVEKLIEFLSLLFKNGHEASRSAASFFKIRNEAFASVFRILSKYVLKISDSNIKKIISLVDLQEKGGDYNLELVKLISAMLSQSKSIDIAILSAESLNTIWKSLTSERLFLNQRHLHVLLIKTILSEPILTASVGNETVSEMLLDFCVSVISYCEGRRTLMPTLIKALSDYQLEFSSNFDRCLWIPEVLVRSYIVFQLQSNIFKLEGVIGNLYDNQLKEGDIYNEVYGLPEVSARIFIVTILATTTDENFSKKLWEFVFQNEQEFSLCNVIKKNDGYEEWRRVQIFSLLLLAFRNIDKKFLVSNYLPILIGIVENDPSPLARVYMEWIVSLCLLQDDVAKETMMNKLSQLVESPTLLTSYERMLFLMTQQLPKEKEEEVLTELLCVLLPAATSNKAVIRHFTLSLLCSVYIEIQKKNLVIDKEVESVVKNIYDTAITSEAYGTYRSGDATLWDITKDFDLVNITGVVLLRASERDLEYITKESYIKCLSPKQIAALTISIGENNEELWMDKRKQLQFKKTISTRDITGATSAPLQTKSGALNTIVDVDGDTRSVTRSDLIVVSSLVDKPPNLGGICRLCDVLGAGLLTLHDLRVKDHPQFKTVAVTADRWMPMIEVKPENIKNYFREKKKEGYTLIGLEQTDKSVQLSSDLKFPKKSLILLGKEKEGVPGDLLAELDMCVEIKQVGVIRSMNIQTATAVIVHAYSMQHC